MAAMYRVVENLVNGASDDKQLLLIEEINLSTETGNHKSDKEPSNERKFFLMLSCLYLLFTSTGTSIALGVMYVELIDVFQVSRSEAVLVESLYLGLSMGGGIIFSKVIGRYDVGKCVIGSSVIGTLCLIGTSCASHLSVITVLTGCILGLMMGLNMLVSHAVVNWTFPHKNTRISALGFLQLGQSIGQLVFPYMTEALIEKYYWNGTFLILSTVLCFQCVPIGLILCYSSQYFDKKGTQTIKDEQRNVPMYKDLLFVIFLTAFVAFQAFGPLELWFVVDLAVEKGASKINGALLLSVNGICDLFGRLSATAILHKCSGVEPSMVLGLSIFLWGIAHAWVASVDLYWLMVIGMMLRGTAEGHFWPFLPALQIELRGAQQYPTTVAYTNCLAGLAQMAGGYIGGLAADITGGYEFTFYIGAGTAMYASMCLIVILFARNRKERKAKYDQSGSK